MRLPGRLGSLTALDLMTSEVFVLSDRLTVNEAIKKLQEKHHSGAPVVDTEGKLVGTISVRDIVKTKQAQGRMQQTDSAILTPEMAESLVSQTSPKLHVRDVMNSHAPSVTSNAGLIDVARLMSDFHTHRVPVVNTAGLLVGIISTMDILAALIHTADEMEQT